VRQRLEYALLWPWIKLLGLLPRSLARAIGITLGLTVYAVHRRLRHVGQRNLTLAFPEMPSRERRRLLRGEFIPWDASSPKSASSRATQGECLPNRHL